VVLGKRLISAAIVFIAAPVWAAKPIPTSPRTYVYNEGVIRQDSADRLSSLLRDTELKTGHQFVVALFQSLDSEDLETYVNRVFKDWKIGDAKRNDGLLFALFAKEHRWRVEVGYGLEGTLTDLEAADIVRSRAVPLLKSGDVDSGIREAASGLAAKIGGAADSGGPPIQMPNNSGLPWWLRRPALDLEIFLFIFILNIILSLRRHGMRGGGSFWYFDGGSGFGGGGGDFGGFSGGGGSSGGGGASGDW
jgi:uncharacterized protein